MLWTLHRAASLPRSSSARPPRPARAEYHRGLNLGCRSSVHKSMGSRGADPRDSDLVVAARDGQAWALTEIWQRHAAAVTGYLRGRGSAEPDDMTSEVFLAVFERLRVFHGDDVALRSFVFTIAHHKMVD